MSWWSPVRTASGGMRRHKVQAVAIGLVVLVSTASATLGFALLAASNAPFTRAFGAQNGADVTVTVNTGRAGPAALPATRGLSGVTTPARTATARSSAARSPSPACRDPRSSRWWAWATRSRTPPTAG